VSVWGIGTDPGKYGGVGLVLASGDTTSLIGLWPLYGTDELWMGRLDEAICEIARYVGPHNRHVSWIEKPPMTMRKDSLKGDRRGHTTWLGLGRRLGKCEAAWFNHYRKAAKVVTQATWTNRLHGKILAKKKGDGLHRIQEAQRLVVDSAERIKTVRKTCRVDCAEAVLMALAATRSLPLSER